MADYELDTKALDGLTKALKDSISDIKVGIFDDTRNATIGAAHEYGTEHDPKRSFLRMPLETKFPKYIENSGLFNEDLLKKVVTTKSSQSWLQAVAKEALRCVHDAFKTGGWGQWVGWTFPYQSKTGKLLVDTGSLMESVKAEIK